MSSNLVKSFSIAARQRTVAYAVLTALSLILVAHAPVVPVLAGCALVAAGSILRAGVRQRVHDKEA